MSNYSELDFKDLINTTIEELGYSVQMVKENAAAEFFFDGSRVFRAFLNNGHIVISFCALISGTDCIQIYEWIKSKFPLAILTDEYYVDQTGQNHFGADAQAQIEHEREDHILNTLSTNERSIHSVEIKDPFSLMITTPIYPAWDPKAAHAYEKSKESKRIKKQGW